MHAHKRTLYLVLLTLALLLVAAVPAWAAEALTVTPAKSGAGLEVSYTLTAGGLENLTVGQVAGKNVVATFPSGFEIKTSGTALPVEVTVSGDVYYAQIIPTISSDKLSATFVVPAALLPSSGNVTQLAVKNLKVKNAAAAGDRTVKLTFEGPDPDKVLQATVTLVAGVASVTIDQPAAGAQIAAGASVLFKGYVKDAAGNAVQGADVYLGDTKKTSTLSTGYYEFEATAPTTAGNVTYTVKASKTVAEIPTEASAQVTVTVVPGVPKKLDFAVTPGSLTQGQRAKFTVRLRDANDNVTTAGQGGVTVYLTASLASAINDSRIGGRFYSAATGGNEITSVAIAEGQSSADFWLEPTVNFSSGNTLTVKASAQGLSEASKEYTSVASVPAPTSVTLTVTPLATTTKDNTVYPVYGWPVKAVATLDAAADKDYTVKVTLKSNNDDVNWATWDSEAKVTFGATGAKKSGDTVTLAKGKSALVFYMYTTAEAADKALTVKVDIGTMSDDETTQAFKPDLPRPLSAGWNVLSTPLPLAGAGDLASLVGGSDRFEIAYTYENGQWQQVSTQKLEPLKGYFVKMKAAGTAAYNLARVTSPDQAVPATRQLKAGWNLVGVSIPETGTFKVADVLASVSDKYSTVVNPGQDLGNEATFSAVTPDSANDTDAKVSRGDAHWVYMKADGTLAGLAVPQLISP